ncbi:DNA polymerase III subunit gamma and tau [Bifidobacterium aesculapii]|uniref:DNA polymerase III subunit gamma and tau n=1 Tax=Bifidobacterium aesculapii TaxID=1329411 RepID=UPI0006E1A196|nr:DNA polymerase III subunit gamma and tau [Bifidobacterium aesculapii]
MALALYRRYRPDTFAGVIGQDQVTVPLMRALDEGKLTHAYLFSGPRGCGKTSSARILARCVNCAKGPTSHPCGECESCKDLATGGPGSIDVVEIDAASHNGVDDARELRERAGFAPARDRYKIFILDEAHMVTPQGFNALLKIVEEPPEHVMFIFATTEPDKVIGTIRSRTHHYPFRLVPAEVMGPYLEKICEQEHIKAEPGVLKLAMRAGGGSVRDTLSVLDQLMVGSVDGVITHDASVALLGFTPEALIGEAVDAVIAADGKALYGVIQKVVVGGFDPRRFVEDLLARVRDLLVLTLAGDRAENVLSDTAEGEDMADLHRQAAALGLGPLTAIADIINTTLGQMTGAISPRMRLELLAARLLAGREHGFATAAAGAAGVNAGAGAPAPGGMPGAAASGASSAGAHGGFAGASTGPRGGGFAGATIGPHGGGFAGAARNQHQETARPQERGGAAAAATASSASDVSATPASSAAPNTSVAPATASVQSAAPAQSTASVQSAAPAQSAASAQLDTRTPDQKWDAMLATLPDDVRRYVARDKARIKFVATYPKTGRPRVWLRFDTALNKYAFALAVASEPVDGTNKVVAIVRAEVRKAFGEQTDLAPTPSTDDGRKTPPFSKLPPNEQQKIKAQLLQENLQAAAAKNRPGDAAGTAREQEGQSSAQHGDAPSSTDDDSHRARTSLSALPDDDPWAQPAPRPQATAPADHGTAEHHHKHVAVPDLSDDTDPWAQPTPPRPAHQGTTQPQSSPDPWAGTQQTQSADAAPAVPAEAPSPARPQASPDPWNPQTPAAGPRNAPAAAPQRPPVANRPAEPDDPWQDVPPPDEPDDPWNPAPRVAGMPDAASTVSGTPGAAGTFGVAAAVQQQSARPTAPQVSADEDEYSMDDESLGSAVAMSRDELRRLFEVKNVETFAADDPRNPRNMHAAPKHDE